MQRSTKGSLSHLLLLIASVSFAALFPVPASGTCPEPLQHRPSSGKTPTPTPAPAPTPKAGSCDANHLNNCTPCQIIDLAKAQRSGEAAKQAKKEAEDAAKMAAELKAEASDADRKVATEQKRLDDLQLRATKFQLQLKNLSDYTARITKPTPKAGQPGPPKPPTAEEIGPLLESQKLLLDQQRTTVEKAQDDAAAKRDEAAAAQADAASKQGAADAAAKDQGGTSLTDQLKALHFALGIGLVRPTEKDIIDTSITGDSKLVRVTDQERTKIGVWIDLHYPMVEIGRSDHLRVGAFAAVQLASSSGSTLSSLAFGPMFSWKAKPICDDSDKSAYNIGIGIARTKVQRLGDGVIENQPLPAGEQTVRFKKTSVWGPAVIFSFTVF